MATGGSAEKHKHEGLIRPSWPYQSWSEDSFSESAVKLKTPDDQLQDEGEDDNDLFLEEPDHWLNDLDDDVSDNCPITCLLDVLKSPNISCTPEAEEIRSDLVPVMEKTLMTLSTSYKIFKGSYLLPVGSMAENSKINKADEFDFAVILPALVDRDIFSLLLRKDSILTDCDISEFLADLYCEGDEKVHLNFAKRLKQIWAEEMLIHVTSELKIENTTCYGDDVSVAGTFHLKRKDNSVIDLDVCFWVPLDTKLLSSAPDDLEQKVYLLEHCLDEHGLVYAILPRDENIDFSLNNIRFAASCLERQKLLQYGPDNNRLRCYRFCKCIVSKLLPKFQKRQECNYCFESIISSFCLKNIILYLTKAYENDRFWTEKQLPNRVVEVFAIASLCMKVNSHRVSAFLVPYEIQVNRTLRYSVENNCVEKISCREDKKRCILPNIEDITCKLNDDISKHAFADYEEFLKTSEWCFAEVICRLTEVLVVLRTEDKKEREDLTRNPGWNIYGL